MATLPPNDLLDLLLDAICVVDSEGRFLSITGACESIFGYMPEEMLGRPMIEFVHPEDRARTLQAVERIEAGYLQRHFENRYVRKDGSVARIMWSARLSESKGSGWRWRGTSRPATTCCRTSGWKPRRSGNCQPRRRR